MVSRNDTSFSVTLCRPWKNRAIAHANGYSDTYIFLCGVFVVLVSLTTLGTYVMLVPEDAVPHFDISLLATVLFNMVLGEISFTLCHKWLHEVKPELHRYHHCAVHSSFSTNYMFHPVDILIELSIPATIPLLTYLLLNPDEFAYKVTLTIISVWYSFDHDETLGLPHVAHHHYINSNYSIYIKNSKFNPEDKLKRLVFRPDSK